MYHRQTNQFTSRHSDFLHVILSCQMTDSQLEASSQTPVDSHDFMLRTAEIIKCNTKTPPSLPSGYFILSVGPVLLLITLHTSLFQSIC